MGGTELLLGSMELLGSLGEGGGPFFDGRIFENPTIKTAKLGNLVFIFCDSCLRGVAFYDADFQEYRVSFGNILTLSVLIGESPMSYCRL